MADRDPLEPGVFITHTWPGPRKSVVGGSASSSPLGAHWIATRPCVHWILAGVLSARPRACMP